MKSKLLFLSIWILITGVFLESSCAIGMPGTPKGLSSLVALAGTEANRMVEFTFESAKSYEDPFNEIMLDAVFTDPSGVKRRVPAFWAGGTTWHVRYASSITGTHRFQTECSDTENAGLHGMRGEVIITPYRGQNPLFRNGAIRIADDSRHFAHADGTPFFWLGDTWWMGLVKRLRWPEDYQQLAADRREKGFTVIQLVAGLYPDMPAFDERGLGDDGLPWEKNFERIRPEFFDAADRRIEHLVEQGLVPCILGTWGYYLPWLGTEKMKQHWRYIIARWGALPVVWTAAGEQAMPWYLSGSKESETQLLRREWNEVIRYIRVTDPFHRLVTTHPRSNARDELLDPILLDFEMQQTGHGQATAHHAAMAREAWNRPPFVPVISGESRYEALEISSVPGAKEVREAFWAHLLNSGCAGHTYGANGVWQVNLPEQRFGKSPGGFDWGGTPWRESMNLPGSSQLSYAKNFLMNLPWHQLAPDTEIFKDAVSAASTADGSCALAFTTGGKSLVADLGNLKGPLSASWFDPSSGELKPIQGKPFTATGSREFAPPGNNAAGDTDWVLLLKVK
jgi:hypothetical protein